MLTISKKLWNIVFSGMLPWKTSASSGYGSNSNCFLDHYINFSAAVKNITDREKGYHNMFLNKTQTDNNIKIVAYLVLLQLTI